MIPGITAIDKKSKGCQLIDPSCPFDSRIEKKEEEKCINYNQLKYEFATIQKTKNDVMPVRGNSRPKLHPAFEQCPYFFKKFVLSKVVHIYYEHKGDLNQKCPFTVFL